MKKDSNLILIILVAVLLMSNLFLGYMLFFHKNRPNSQGFPNQGFQDIQLTDEQKQNVTSFFSSTTDAAKINDYCSQNRMECFYYCRDINPNNELCSQLMQRRPNSQPAQN